MSGNRVEIDIAVLDKGSTTKTRIKEAEHLRKVLTDAKNVGEGTRSGNQAARMAGFQEYTTAGGVTGRAGASARDFAAESQGLGGLVRLYATLAANLYAAGAAFTALKSAADVTNMVEGMNQLGAASGVALGSLSKAFVQATDGAISLREAMQSVTKASAAGLSSAQILDIGKYAKTASQALGVDMADAVSRLTRGITKLEPELLDELGIFTKIDPAVQKYAVSLGKAAGSLSDFERRQAFAIAVLDEVKQKFGDIEMTANPFQKLEASIRDLSTATLQLVNKVLVPIVDILANNSALLTTALGLLGAKLIGMAIPAIVGWRKELVEAAKAAKTKAKEINELFGEKSFETTMAKFNLPELQKNLDAAKTKYAQAAKDIADIQSGGARATKTSKSIQAGTFGEDPKDFTRTQAQINDLTKKGTQDADKYADALRRAKEAKQEELKISKQIAVAEAGAEQVFRRTTLDDIERARISKRVGAKSEKLDILSSISGDVESGGFTYATDKMRQSIKKTADMSDWDKLSTKIQGTFIAGASRVTMFLRAFGSIGMTIAGAIAAFEIFDQILGNVTKEQKAFESAVEQSNETVETATKVLEKYKDQITAQSIVAKGNIFIDLNDLVEKQANDLDILLKKMNTFSSIKDTIFDFFGFGARDDLAKSLGENFAKQLALVPEGPAKKALEEKLKGILGASGIDKDSLEAALDEIGRESLPAIAKEANMLFTEAKNRAGEARDNIKALEDAMKKARTSIGGIKAAMQLSDPASKFGSDLIDIGIAFASSLKDGETTIANIKQLLGDKELLTLIDPQQYEELKNLGSIYEQVSKKIKQLTLEGADKGVIASYVNSLQMAFQDINKIAIKVIDRGFSLMNKQLDIASKRADISSQQKLLGILGPGPGVSQAKASLEIKDLELQKQQVNIISDLNKTIILNNALQAQSNTIEQLKLLQQKSETTGGLLSEEDKVLAAQLDIRQRDLSNLPGMGTKGSLLFGQLYGDDTSIATADPVATSFRKQMDQASLQAQNQIKSLSSLQKIVGVEGKVGEIKEKLDQDLKRNQIAREKLQIEKEILELQTAGSDIIAEDIQQQINQKDLKLQDLAQQDRKNKLQAEIDSAELVVTEALKMKRNDIAKVADKVAKAAFDELQALEAQIPEEERLLGIKQKQLAITREYQKGEAFRLRNEAKDQLTNTIFLQQLSLRTQLAEKQAGLGLITPTDLTRIRGAEALNQLELETAQQLREAASKRNQALSEVEQNRRLALEAGPLSSDQEKDFQQAEDAAKNYYAVQKYGIEDVARAKKELIELDLLDADRMTQYGKKLEGLFQGLEEEIIKFAETGKFSFKDVANSFLKEILRMELAAQRAQFLKSMGGSTSIVSAIASFFTGTPVPSAMGNAYSNTGMMKYAKGGVFEVPGYAKGGTFTNQIVNQPTLFKAAKGLGVMGEAGPEAIMPLKRDSSGRLGVSGGGNDVSVVVNNYGKERAEVKESTDGRGNRKIEVVVGEMVSGELTRVGSPLQQTFTNTYGIGMPPGRR